MNKRFGSIAIVVAAAAAAAGLLASPSNSAEKDPTRGGSSTAASCTNQIPIDCGVALTGAGPSPSTLKMLANSAVVFDNTDSVPHTVVFANGLCSLTLHPGEQGGPGVLVNGVKHPDCNNGFPYFVGRYAYTVDGEFPGTVITMPLPRSVTLAARTHTIRRGTRLTLHGRVVRANAHLVPPKAHFRVIVLARHNSKQPFEPIATVRARFQDVTYIGNDRYSNTYRWKLKVRPGATTTYIAKVTAQLPHGQQGKIWTNAKSRPFTVRVRH